MLRRNRGVPRQTKDRKDSGDPVEQFNNVHQWFDFSGPPQALVCMKLFHFLVLSALVVAVLGGVLLRKQRGLVYWSFSGLRTAILSLALFSEVVLNTDVPSNAPFTLVGMFVTIPMIAAFGVERLDLLGPHPILAAVLGFVAYLLVFYIIVYLLVGVCFCQSSLEDHQKGASFGRELFRLASVWFCLIPEEKPRVSGVLR